MTHRITFAGDHSMAPEYDAHGIALVLWKDAEYVQYFMVRVPDPALRTAQPSVGPGFVAAVADLAAAEVERLVLDEEWGRSAADVERI